MVTLDQEVGGPSSDDARSQRAPYRYDLYAVVNHDGQTIDSGHCEFFRDSLLARYGSDWVRRYLYDIIRRSMERVQRQYYS